jgi:hypothetical protein
MWPALKAKVPDAELYLCRYSSMYDAAGWGEVCKRYDAAVGALQQEVGGIVHMGELGKAALYHAIAGSAVMWYPGVVDFAETSCIARSKRRPAARRSSGRSRARCRSRCRAASSSRATPTRTRPTRPPPSTRSRICSTSASGRRSRIGACRSRAARTSSYGYPGVAAEWEGWLLQTFRDRYEANKVGVLRNLLHYDDHTAAKIVAEEIADIRRREAEPGSGIGRSARGRHGALRSRDRRQGPGRRGLRRTRRGSDRGVRAQRPVQGRPRPVQGLHARHRPRLRPGLVLARAAEGVSAHPRHRHRLRRRQHRHGEGRRATARLSDRATFIQGAAYDFDTQAPCDLWALLPEDGYDGVFVGEFLEHVGDCTAMVDAVETVVSAAPPSSSRCRTGRSAN